jgi:cation:H+ antiporter
MTLLDILIYGFSFLVIWFASGMAVSSIEGISKKLNMNSFIVSFILLGIFTSLPEAFLAISSTVEGKPEISVGNLVGGKIILFLLLIPLVAVSGKGAKIIKDIPAKKLLFALFVISLPLIFLLDSNLHFLEGIILLLAYISLIFVIEQKSKLPKVEKVEIPKRKYKKKSTPMTHIFAKLIAGSVLIFFSSNIILNNTIKLAEIMQVSPFLISLFLIAIGTNLPEFTVGVRSILEHNRKVALGHYIGSASSQTLVFGFLILLNPNGIVVLKENLLITLGFALFGLVIFYIFAISKKILSRKEGFILLFLYVVFVVIEIAASKGII